MPQALTSRPTQTDGGDDPGGGSNLDVEAVARALVPPNSTEVSKTTAPDTWFVIYETTESIDSLRSFYESAIPGAGLTVVSTTTANGGVSWAMATDESGTFGGAVSVFPSGDGKNVIEAQLTPGPHRLAVQAGDDMHRTLPGLCQVINVTAQ